MASPFPGMDPFIESCRLWEDFHLNLISELQHALSRILPDRYAARSGERYYVVLATPDDFDPAEHMAQADVAVSRPSAPAAASTSAAAAQPPSAVTSEDEPVLMHAFVESEFREAFVEIYLIEPEKKLVTTIEALSPSNKRPSTPGWKQYLRKRQAHMEGCANFVELDLLRGGQRMPMREDWPASPYYVLTCWKKYAPRCKVWPAYFDRPLPKLCIPLAPPDEDLTLDLQPLVDTIYERSRYAVDIDYQRPCRPPLDEGSKAWLAERLQFKE